MQVLGEIKKLLSCCTLYPMTHLIFRAIAIVMNAALIAVGGALPFILLLWWYSLREGRRLRKRALTVRERVADIDTEIQAAEDTMQKMPIAGDLVTTGTLDEMNKLLERWVELNTAILDKQKKRQELIEFYDWAKNYNFTSTIESIIERKYTGQGFTKGDWESISTDHNL